MVNIEQIPTLKKTIIRRRRGEIVGRIDHGNKESGESKNASKETKNRGVNKEIPKEESLEDLAKIERNLRAEVAGWKVNKGPQQISDKEANRQWKKLTNQE